MIANTPEAPYYAVIFTSTNTENVEDYSKMAERMVELASKQEGFLGIESARNQVGITISYWKNLESIKKWKENVEHSFAQVQGGKNGIKPIKPELPKWNEIMGLKNHNQAFQ
jgi:heme-degrading monooxygenase HmoA